MRIRQETVHDRPVVDRLVTEAFKSAPHASGEEGALVAALRQGGAFLPTLALVAEQDGEIVGHILFTKASVGEQQVLVLAPLSVKPRYQGQGVGTALILEGHRIAREMGYPYAFVLGSETYYPRVGYRPADQLGVEVPQGIPAKNFMAIRLLEDAPALHGPLVYAKEFGL